MVMDGMQYGLTAWLINPGMLPQYSDYAVAMSFYGDPYMMECWPLAVDIPDLAPDSAFPAAALSPLLRAWRSWRDQPAVTASDLLGAAARAGLVPRPDSSIRFSRHGLCPAQMWSPLPDNHSSDTHIPHIRIIVHVYMHTHSTTRMSVSQARYSCWPLIVGSFQDSCCVADPRLR